MCGVMGIAYSSTNRNQYNFIFSFTTFSVHLIIECSTEPLLLFAFCVIFFIVPDTQWGRGLQKNKPFSNYTGYIWLP